MLRRIITFDRDEEHQWLAALDRSHFEHMRHDPPLRTRNWTLTAGGRDSRIGLEIDCRKCDEAVPPDIYLNSEHI